MTAPFTVSVIIPNHNYGDYVGAAIVSALNLDWPDVGVIVVDNGSTDHSRAVISRSRGDLVIFLDSDDLLAPFWINLAVAGLLAVLAVVAAPILAALYGEPRLFWVTVLLGTSFVFTGAATQHRALLQRSMLAISKIYLRKAKNQVLPGRPWP